MLVISRILVTLSNWTFVVTMAVIGSFESTLFQIISTLPNVLASHSNCAVVSTCTVKFDGCLVITGN